MSDEREYWRAVIVGRINEQQPIYAGELLDELVDLRIITAAERERGDHYRNACIQTEREVQQTLGYALGYPWCKDDQRAFPGSTEADGVCVGEHTAETLAMEIAERLKRVEAELRRWRGCPSCKEDHDDNVMCPPHEVRTSGRAWFHTQARKWAERAEELRAERNELQRKLDACQCETRVLNESMLIEVERERDQLAAKCGLLREALEMAHHELTTLHGLWACDNFDVYDKALADGCDHNAAWERFCDEMWQIDTALPIEQIDNVLAATPATAAYAERIRKLENAVQAGRDYRDWVEVGCPDVGHDVLTPEQHFEFALDVLDATEGGEG